MHAAHLHPNTCLGQLTFFRSCPRLRRLNIPLPRVIKSAMFNRRSRVCRELTLHPNTTARAYGN